MIMCDCSTYLAVRRVVPRAGPYRSLLSRGAHSSYDYPLYDRCFFSPSSFYVASSRCQFLISNKRNSATTVRNQPRYESVDISPTGCEVRARINQAAQLGQLYSQKSCYFAIRIGLRGNNGIHSNYKLRDNFFIYSTYETS